MPSLRYVPAWFPLAKFKRDSIKWRQLNRRMVETPFNTTKELMVFVYYVTYSSRLTIFVAGWASYTLLCSSGIGEHSSRPGS